MPMNELELLKSKIKYRSHYRGTKEMDTLLTSFAKAVVEKLSLNELEALNVFMNCEDSEIYEFYQYNKPMRNFDNKKILEMFRNFKL